jgi:hypothetical protein
VRKFAWMRFAVSAAFVLVIMGGTATALVITMVISLLVKLENRR